MHNQDGREDHGRKGMTDPLQPGTSPSANPGSAQEATVSYAVPNPEDLLAHDGSKPTPHTGAGTGPESASTMSIASGAPPPLEPSPASAREGQPSRRKLGEYLLVREIGRGGMGTVFEAIQESLDRRVAVKVLRGAAMMDDRAIRRFHRE